MTSKSSKSTDVVSVKKLNKDDVAAVATMEEALALIAQEMGGVVQASELGDGFAMADKAKLVGVPFLIMDSTVSLSDDFMDEDGKPAEFVVLRCIDGKNQKFIITDGSTGIRATIIKWRTEQGRNGGWYCAKGLRDSDYWIDERGLPFEHGISEKKVSKAITYYIDDSAV